MGVVTETRDRERIETFLRRTPDAHLYALADLDELFWDETTWFATGTDGRDEALVLLLGKLRIPIVYAVAPPGDPATQALLEELRPRLPESFFANLPVGLEAVFGDAYDWEPEGEHAKYALPDRARIDTVDASAVRALGPEDHAELRTFLERDAYAPGEETGRFLEPYMIELWPFVGIREAGKLVCVAGTHVLSDRYRVAALGNIATRPDRRGRGLARAATAFLCRELFDRVDHLGLNVKTDNAAAIRCYEQLGFEPVCAYLEGTFTKV